MKTLKYVIYREGKYYVSQCLNVEVSSFGNTVQEALDNLNEALELYFEDKDSVFSIVPIKETMLGETKLKV
jgi:predicted RNase H-like HicB family nuclease